MEAIELNRERFLELLGKLIGETKFLVNNPPEFIPEETRAAKHVMDALSKYTEANGGPLKIRDIQYHAGRSNLIIELPGKSDRVISFVGSHLDVVPANPANWTRDPFNLTVEGDMLYGRGTTDCLGHVALLTELFIELCERKVPLDVTVIAVFIASEENSSIAGVGIDELMKNGELEKVKKGPVFWVDVADTNPCIGTAGVVSWKMQVGGKGFHSGIPFKAINAIELGIETVRHVQDHFYETFPPHTKEHDYKFVSPSTLKPTRISSTAGQSLNIIPGECTVEGDIRLTPFYDMPSVIKTVTDFVSSVDVAELPTHGPASKYHLPLEGKKGTVSIEFEKDFFEGIACNLESPGYKALHDAVKTVKGEAKPYSITGSLPLVADLQREGLDIQLTGYGRMEAYHADNEFARFSELNDGMKILCRVLAAIDADRS